MTSVAGDHLTRSAGAFSRVGLDVDAKSSAGF
jgi:hypothetical protein